MKKAGIPKIICSCEDRHLLNHTCEILRNAAANNPPPTRDTVENMLIDSNSSAATNPGNENIRVVPPMDEDSGIDNLLNVNALQVPSALSSGNTSPDIDMLSVPSASRRASAGSASIGSDITPDTESSLSRDISSGNVSISTSEHQPESAKAVSDSAGDKSTLLVPSAAAGTDNPPSLSSTPGTPTPAAAATNAPGPSAVRTSPSRPSSLSSGGLRRSYHEFSKTGDAVEEDEILRTVNYVCSEDMVAKKKRMEGEPNPRGKSSGGSSSGGKSSGGSNSRSESLNASLISRDTSSENLSGGSTDPQEEKDDWYTKMRTKGPKVSITGSIRPDGMIGEMQERRSSTAGGSILVVNLPPEDEARRSSAAVGGALVVNLPPEEDTCQDIYFNRKSPSLERDEAAPDQDENPQPKNDGDSEEKQEEKDE